MNNKILLFTCGKCNKIYQASDIEYRKVFWKGEMLTESYCPYCGTTNQKKVSFTSSGGGKF